MSRRRGCQVSPWEAAAQPSEALPSSMTSMICPLERHWTLRMGDKQAHCPLLLNVNQPRRHDRFLCQTFRDSLRCEVWGTLGSRCPMKTWVLQKVVSSPSMGLEAGAGYGDDDPPPLRVWVPLCSTWVETHSPGPPPHFPLHATLSTFFFFKHSINSSYMPFISEMTG